MSDSQHVVRQWMLIKALSSRMPGATIKELAEELKVNEKTIRRDITNLLTAGFPLEETSGDFNRKHWRIDGKRTAPDIAFKYDEAIALYLGQRMLEPLAGTFFWEAIQRASRKVRTCLGRQALRYLDKMAGAFHQTTTGASNYSAKAEIIDELLIGIEDRKVVFITYQSAQATEAVTYDTHPYGLTYHRGSLYLVGFAPQHNALRHWKVDRIETAQADVMPYPIPTDFDLTKHFADSFGVYHGSERIKVSIRFSSTAARYVQESQWHASQKLTPQPDGSIIAEFQLSSLMEIKSWTLSFGAAAQVLEPPELRKQIREELGQLSRAYDLMPPIPAEIEKKKTTRSTKQR